MLMLDGRSAAASIDAKMATLAAGVDFTLECWYMPQELKGRRGLLSKAELSEYGLFVSDGAPEFFVHLNGSYKTVKGKRGTLQPGHWHHIAGVYDGNELRLYLNGSLIAKKAASGQRTVNQLPFMIGSDVDGAGKPTSYTTGRVDEVRLSAAAVYSGTRIDLERRLSHERDTVFLFHMDGDLGPWIYDEGNGQRHAQRLGSARVEIIQE